MTYRDRIHGILFVDVWMNLVQSYVGALSGGLWGARAVREAINGTEYFFLVARTSITYGGIGRIYGKCRGIGCSLRSCMQETAGSETAQDTRVRYRPVLNDPWILCNRESAENAPSSKSCHKAAGVRQRVKVVNALITNHW